MDKVTILGASGMLGSACAKVFPDAAVPSRDEFDALSDKPDFNGWVVNCIGAIPQRINDEFVMRKLNDEFSNQLPNSNNKVLQIATDCVFSGREGNYTESSIKDPVDDYGKTKLAGENFKSMNIRCSIIGPDVKNVSLFEWVRSQPIGATIFGYTDHYWNGVSTKVFAKLLKGIIETKSWQSGTFHFVPKDSVSKFELVNLIAKRLARSDLKIEEKETGKKVDRTLATNFPDLNQNLWKLAGYSEIPTIEQIVNDISL